MNRAPVSPNNKPERMCVLIYIDPITPCLYAAFGHEPGEEKKNLFHQEMSTEHSKSRNPTPDLCRFELLLLLLPVYCHVMSTVEL